MPIEFHRDGPWELPEGWVWARLGDLCEFIGRGRGPTYVEEGEDGVPVVNQKCIRWRKFEDRFLRQTARPAFERLPRRLHLQPGDILWNSTGTGTIGRAVIYDGHLGSATVDSHVTIIRPRRIDSNFVCAYIETMRVQLLVTDENVGSTNQLELPRAFVQGLLIPVPPAAEQRRIVAQIDELFAEIADGELTLVRARDDLDTWRRALLKAAITGELTQQWRLHGDVKETGTQIVERIRREIGSGTGELRFDSTSSAGLPETWAWCTVGEAGEVKLGRQRSPQHHSGKHMRPYLRVANVFENRLDLSDVKSMNFTPAEFENFALKSGDVLLNEGQSPELLGRPAIYRDEIDGCCFQNTLLRFRPRPGVTSEFALTVFRSYMRLGRFRREARITTNIAHLSQSRFVAIEFPIPPVEEQNEIVRQVQSLEESAFEQFEHIETSLAGTLRHAILKEAFEGRLIDQNPDDEHAGLFLSSICREADSGKRDGQGQSSGHSSILAAE